LLSWRLTEIKRISTQFFLFSERSVFLFFSERSFFVFIERCARITGKVILDEGVGSALQKYFDSG
jgi:hypothetical protein